MRLLIDMNLTPRWVQSLSEAGHEAVHWSTIGSPSAPDSAICEHARRHGFVVITGDMDFPQILAYTAGCKPSVVLVRGEPMIPEARAISLIDALDRCSTELEIGAILALDLSGKPRARLLPLR